MEARRWQLLVLIADTRMTVTAAAPLVGLNYDYARRVVQRSNREGPPALRDRRREFNRVARITGRIMLNDRNCVARNTWQNRGSRQVDGRSDHRDCRV